MDVTEDFQNYNEYQIKRLLSKSNYLHMVINISYVNNKNITNNLVRNRFIIDNLLFQGILNLIYLNNTNTKKVLYKLKDFPILKFMLDIDSNINSIDNPIYEYLLGEAFISLNLQNIDTIIPINPETENIDTNPETENIENLSIDYEKEIVTLIADTLLSNSEIKIIETIDIENIDISNLISIEPEKERILNLFDGNIFDSFDSLSIQSPTKTIIPNDDLNINETKPQFDELNIDNLSIFENNDNFKTTSPL
jgi:hypothetical protein